MSSSERRLKTSPESGQLKPNGPNMDTCAYGFQMLPYITILSQTRALPQSRSVILATRLSGRIRRPYCAKAAKEAITASVWGYEGTTLKNFTTFKQTGNV